MLSKTALTIATALVVSAPLAASRSTELAASGGISFYGIVERVVFEPAEALAVLFEIVRQPLQPVEVRPPFRALFTPVVLERARQQSSRAMRVRRLLAAVHEPFDERRGF